MVLRDSLKQKGVWSDLTKKFGERIVFDTNFSRKIVCQDFNLDMKCNKVLCDEGRVFQPNDKEVDWRVRPLDDSLKQYLTLETVKLIAERQMSEKQIHARDDLISKALNDWREQVAKFDDESVEYVLSSGLIDFISKESSNIQHCQDLQNICCQYLNQLGREPYVPFFAKVYKNELTDIILK